MSAPTDCCLQVLALGLRLTLTLKAAVFQTYR
jgi:hypothetical protein